MNEFAVKKLILCMAKIKLVTATVNCTETENAQAFYGISSYKNYIFEILTAKLQSRNIPRPTRLMRKNSIWCCMLAFARIYVLGQRFLTDFYIEVMHTASRTKTLRYIYNVKVIDW